MRNLLTTLLAAAFLGCAAPAAHAQDRITFGTDWLAEAEYGGYYQALATGIYRSHGLDVTIRQGGPSVNQTQLLLAGRLDVNIASNSFVALNFVTERIPFRVVAAMFQKDPSVLIAHPGQGNDNFPALRGKPIMISADTRAGWWNFLRAKFGYSDAQIRPYTFNLQPFLANKGAIQQGFLGSEPYSIRQAAGFDPVVLLVADAGFAGYAQLFAVSDRMIETQPDIGATLRRCLDRGLGRLSRRRPGPGERADPEGQPGDDRGPARLWAGGPEEEPHPDVGRRGDKRHRRDDRGALGGFLCHHGGGGRVSAGPRCPPRLYAAVRQPRGRAETIGAC